MEVGRLPKREVCPATLAVAGILLARVLGWKETLIFTIAIYLLSTISIKYVAHCNKCWKSLESSDGNLRIFKMYVCRPKESQLSCEINGMHYGQIK